MIGLVLYMQILLPVLQESHFVSESESFCHLAHRMHLCELPLLMKPTTLHVISSEIDCAEGACTFVIHPDMATTTYNEIDTSIRILVAIN